MSVSMFSSNQIFSPERESDMIKLRIRHNIGEFDKSEGPGITSNMAQMGGQEFEIERSVWESHGRSVRAKGISWLRKWLEEPNNLLNQGEEI